MNYICIFIHHKWLHEKKEEEKERKQQLKLNQQYIMTVMYIDND